MEKFIAGEHLNVWVFLSWESRTDSVLFISFILGWVKKTISKPWQIKPKWEKVFSMWPLDLSRLKSWYTEVFLMLSSLWLSILSIINMDDFSPFNCWETSHTNQRENTGTWAVQTGRTKGTCDGPSRLHGGLGRQADKTKLCWEVKKAICGTHLGATLEPRWYSRGSLRICGSLHRPVQTHYRYWRTGDYISGKLWSPCAGDRGTKAQRWEIWWAGGLDAGSERRQACRLLTPASLWTHAHTAHTELQAKTQGNNNALTHNRTHVRESIVLNMTCLV